LAGLFRGIWIDFGAGEVGGILVSAARLIFTDAETMLLPDLLTLPDWRWSALCVVCSVNTWCPSSRRDGADSAEFRSDFTSVVVC